MALRVVGWSLVGLAVAHVGFARRFRWREEFGRVSLLNRRIFYVHCFFLCLVLVGMGVLCAVAPEALLERSELGRWVASGLAVFWFCRLIVQWAVYDWVLWRGKRFETVMHGMFTGVWIFYTGVFAMVAWGQWQMSTQPDWLG